MRECIFRFKFPTPALSGSGYTGIISGSLMNHPNLRIFVFCIYFKSRRIKLNLSKIITPPHPPVGHLPLDEKGKAECKGFSPCYLLSL